MDINDLQKLAGVDKSASDPQSIPQHNLRAIEREKNIKPGDNEWFDLWFGNQNSQLNMPRGFRGRR